MSKELGEAAELLQAMVNKNCFSLKLPPTIKLEHGVKSFVISYKSVQVSSEYPPKGNESVTFSVLDRCTHELASRVQSVYGSEKLSRFWQAWTNVPVIVGRRP